jgi:hypothetical protein
MSMPAIKIGTVETETFPLDDAETTKRLDNYRRCRQLFLGNHYDVFERVQRWLEREADKSITYVICNFAGIISKVAADMLFGEMIKVVAGEPDSAEQELIKEIYLNNNLQTTNYEMALSSSWRGEAIYKVRYGKKAGHENEKEHSIIEAVSPSYFYPVLHPDNIRGLQGGDFAWIKEQGDNKYLRIERQRPGEIINELWQLESAGGKILSRAKLDTFPEYVGMEEREETKYPGLLFKFVPNWRLEDNFWGISDYFDLETVFDELNNRFSRISRVLDKHESPFLILPPGTMKQDENNPDRWYIEKEDLQAIEIDPEDTSSKDLPRYLTWDAELSAAFQQIDKLLEIAFFVSETSPDAFGMGERSSTESGRALKFRLMRLLSKINRKKIYFDEALKEMLYAAMYLENQHGGSGIDPEKLDIRLEWGDGIPADPLEQAQVEAIRTSGKSTTSRRSAIRRLDDLEGDDLEEELTAIDDDEAGQATVPVETGRRPLDLEGGEGEQ